MMDATRRWLETFAARIYRAGWVSVRPRIHVRITRPGEIPRPRCVLPRGPGFGEGAIWMAVNERGHAPLPRALTADIEAIWPDAAADPRPQLAFCLLHEMAHLDWRTHVGWCTPSTTGWTPDRCAAWNATVLAPWERVPLCNPLDEAQADVVAAHVVRAHAEDLGGAAVVRPWLAALADHRASSTPDSTHATAAALRRCRAAPPQQTDPSVQIQGLRDALVRDWAETVEGVWPLAPAWGVLWEFALMVKDADTRRWTTWQTMAPDLWAPLAAADPGPAVPWPERLAAATATLAAPRAAAWRRAAESSRQPVYAQPRKGAGIRTCSTLDRRP